jgi:hypothetical protein
MLRRKPRPLDLIDRLDLATTQLQMVREQLGIVTAGHVRQCALMWSCHPTEYGFLNHTLQDQVT